MKLNDVYIREHIPVFMEVNGYTGNSIEIGVGCGYFSEQILLGWQSLQKHYMVDCWSHQDELIYNDPANFNDDKHEEIYNYVIERFKDKNCEIIRKMSVEAAKDFPDEFFDLIYIDANHSKESCKADLEAWYPKLKVGGIIAGHDYMDSHNFGVKSAVDEFFSGKEIFTTNLDLHKRQHPISWMVRKIGSFGIMYNIWWTCDSPQPNLQQYPGQSIIDELNYSYKLSKKCNVPIKILIDDRNKIDISLLNIDTNDFVWYNVPDDCVNLKTQWVRKLIMFKHAPFHLNLFLDTDAFIVEDDDYLSYQDYPRQNCKYSFKFPIHQTIDYGMSICYDEFTNGVQLKDSNGILQFGSELNYLINKYFYANNTIDYFPMFNFGSFFFDKYNNRLQQVIDLSIDILKNSEISALDQVAFSIACAILNYYPFILHNNVWNNRVCYEDNEYSHPITRILHNPYWFRKRVSNGKIKL